MALRSERDFAVLPEPPHFWQERLWRESNSQANPPEGGERIGAELTVAFMVDEVHDQPVRLAEEAYAHRAWGVDFNRQTGWRQPTHGRGEQPLDGRR